MEASKILKTFIWLLLIFVGVQANGLIASNNGYELNVTTNLEDYIDQVQRQYSYVISDDEKILAEFRAGYERQLETIEAHEVLIESELIAYDKKFYTLQFLNDINKHCVQKYRYLLYSVANLRYYYNNCISSARTNLNTILQSCQTNINTLNSYLNTNFKNGIADCEKKNAQSYANRTTCVVNFNYGLSVSFDTTQRAFLTNLDSARCAADTRIRQTVDCTYRYANASLTSIGSTTNAIDGCISGLESCPRCQDQNGNSNNNDTSIIVPQPQCPNVINVFTRADLYRNETISNPFYGLNSTLDCILVNFLQPN